MIFLIPPASRRTIFLAFLFSLVVSPFRTQAQTFPLKVKNNQFLETKKGKPVFIRACSYPLTSQTTQISYHLNRLSNSGINTLFISLNNSSLDKNPKSYSRQISHLRKVAKEAALFNLSVLIYPEDTFITETENSVFAKLKSLNNIIWLLNEDDFAQVHVFNPKQLRAVYLNNAKTDTISIKTDLVVVEGLNLIKSKPIILLFQEPAAFSDSAALAFRKVTYSGLIKGSTGIITQSLNNKKWSANNPFYFHMRLFSNIFDSIPWFQFKPVNNDFSCGNQFLTSAKIDTTSAFQLWLYYAKSGMISLNLSLFKSPLKFCWVQPSTGRAFYSQVNTEPAEQLFLPPEVSSPDWLLIIKDEK
jgi:hypothetical protein